MNRAAPPIRSRRRRVFQQAVPREGRAYARAVLIRRATTEDARRARVTAVEAFWESLGLSISVAFWDALLERYIGPAREALGAELEATRQEGRELPFEDAIELALAE